ncbi:MAG: hypothetical protein V4754_11405 [Pseudomonadota bacterium]
MYHIYLCTLYEQVYPWSETKTTDPVAAREAFADLVNCRILDGHKFALVASYNHCALAIHRFDHSPGHSAYWRGRLDQIDWRGAAAGTGAAPLVRRPGQGGAGR